MKKVYLDNNATTKVDEVVVEIMKPYFSEMYGNPNSLHKFGSETHKGMSKAINQTYSAINASDEDDIVFTSCATESNNWVIKSVWLDLIRNGERDHIITTEVEHPSVLSTFKFLESEGVKVTYLPVNSEGYVSAETVKSFVTGNTALVSVMMANNETGVIFPIKEIADICKANGTLFHTDAVQAVGKIPVDVQDLGVDFLSMSAHKFHGPNGVGALYIKAGKTISPMFHGGSQMGGLRSGTLNVPLIIGMGQAIENAVNNIPTLNSETRRLRDKIEDALLSQLKDTFVVGDKDNRTPNTILISVRGVEGEGMLWDLDKKFGISAATGSACASEDLEANPVLEAIGAEEDLAHTAIRLTLSRYTSEEDADYTIEKFIESANRLRAISSSYATVQAQNII